jgi:cell division septation protein DedD
MEHDGFHEIQLNGKQLVFLFMAVTVVSVAIFLSGVLVGRGVRAEQASRAEQAAAAAVDLSGPRPASTATPQPSASADPTTAAPPTPVDDLSYFRRLEQPNQPAEDLKPIPKAAAKAPAATSGAAPASAAATAPAKDTKTKETTPKDVAAKTAAPAASATDAATAPPAGSGYAVQIAAVNVRGEADAMAKRLSAKGYSAYVVPANAGGPSVYRVRVGTFKTRREAATMAAKLQKEERLSVTPWVTQ